MTPSTKCVLVTGASGFVGANLTRRLCDDGHDVTAAVRPGADLWRLEAPGSDSARPTVQPLDVADDAAVARVVERLRPQWTFHLAAHGAYHWQTDTRRIFSTNLLGTVSLVEACRACGCEAFVNAGSSSEYGYKDHAPDEDEALAPSSPYAVAKAAASLYCRREASDSPMRACSLRLYTVYGPLEDPRRLLPRLLVHGLRGELPPLVSPEVAHDFVAVEEVVDAFLLAAREAPQGAVYNVGSGRQTTLREMVQIVCGALELELEPQWGSAPQRRWDTTTWLADPGRIGRELGWRSQMPLEDGVARMAHWLRASVTLWPVYGLAESKGASQAAGTGEQAPASQARSSGLGR